MKICYITHDMHLQTGIGAVSRNLIERVAARHPDWEIAVITTEASGHPLETTTMPMDKRRLLKTIFRLRTFLKDYDVVHALDGFPYGLVAVVSTLGLRKKIFITAVGSGSIYMLSKPYLRPFLRFCYRRADTLFAISSYTARKVKERVGGLEIVPVNLGINLSELEPQASDVKLAKQIIDKKPYMLTVGSFKARKGQKQIAEGFIEAVKKVPDLNYVLEGSPNNSYADEIKALIDKAGLSHKVFFLGNISKDMLRVVYRNAVLFAMLPQEVQDDTDIEGFGLVFLDAAAAGLPVIASTQGPSEESVASRKNGILVDPRNTHAISDAIVRICTDDVLRKKMSQASLDFAHHMSWDRMVDIYMPHYESCAKAI